MNDHRHMFPLQKTSHIRMQHWLYGGLSLAHAMISYHCASPAAHSSKTRQLKAVANSTRTKRTNACPLQLCHIKYIPVFRAINNLNDRTLETWTTGNIAVLRTMSPTRRIFRCVQRFRRLYAHTSAIYHIIPHATCVQ